MELAFKFQFVKSIDFFLYKYVVRVCKVVSVCNAFDNAETFLQGFCKVFCQRFTWCAVKCKTKASLAFPQNDLALEVIHNIQSQCFTFWCCVAFACKGFYTFVQTDVAQCDCSIAILQQWIDRFVFAKTCNGTILPVNRRNIRCNIFQFVITQHQGFFTHFQSVFQNSPEFTCVTLSGQTNVSKVK